MISICSLDNITRLIKNINHFKPTSHNFYKFRNPADFCFAFNKKVLLKIQIKVIKKACVFSKAV